MDNLVKYPRTYHFSFSPELQNDDRYIEDLSDLKGSEVVVTEKLDGENVSIYSDGYVHPRSLFDDKHPSRSWLKQHAATFSYLIPKGWRICGENMYARHSIYYDNLESFFYCFNIWDEKNNCLSWDETLKWCNYFNIHVVPELYRGPFDHEKIKSIFRSQDKDKQEGIVCRVVDPFSYEKFSTHVAKAVRKGHVQTDKHWKEHWIPNKIKKDKE